jgi:hypothetical protein
VPKWLWIALLGVALLFPGARYWVDVWISDPVRPADGPIAFQRLAEIPLSEAVRDRGVEFTVAIPSDAAWRRVIRWWGDPGYFIGIVSPGPKSRVDSLQELGAHAEARIGGQPVPLETAFAPYGYSTDGRPAGLSFQAPPGAVVRIHVTVAKLPVPASDLVVEPHWTVGTKDHLVGIAIEKQLHLRALATASVVTGVITILIAAFLFSRRGRSPAASV